MRWTRQPGSAVATRTGGWSSATAGVTEAEGLADGGDQLPMARPAARTGRRSAAQSVRPARRSTRPRPARRPAVRPRGGRRPASSERATRRPLSHPGRGWRDHRGVNRARRAALVGLVLVLGLVLAGCGPLDDRARPRLGGGCRVAVRCRARRLVGVGVGERSPGTGDDTHDDLQPAVHECSDLRASHDGPDTTTTPAGHPVRHARRRARRVPGGEPGDRGHQGLPRAEGAAPVRAPRALRRGDGGGGPHLPGSAPPAGHGDRGRHDVGGPGHRVRLLRRPLHPAADGVARAPPRSSGSRR